MLEQDLQELGLSEKEAAVYLAALELGLDTVQHIAKKAKVNRATTYVILKSLMKKGLVSEIDKGKKTFFAAEEPERLVKHIDQQIKNLSVKRDNIKPLMSKLRLITNRSSDKPIVRFFEGNEGVHAMQDEFIKEFSSEKEAQSKNDYDAFFLAYSRDKLHEIFTPEELTHGRKERLYKKVIAHPLYNWNKPTEDFPLSTGVKLDSKLFPFPCDIAVFKDKIRLISLTKIPTAVLIIDKNLAEGLRSLFRLAHEGAKKVKK